MKNLIQKAILIAMKAHEGEVRKGDGKTPYVLHPIETGITISFYSSSESLIASAILHDCLENGKIKYDELVEEFGEDIAKTVEALTEDKKIKDWAERKGENINKLRNFKINDFKIAYHIKAIDNLVNMKELLIAIENQGEKAWKRFNAPKDYKMNYFRVALDDLKQELPTDLLEKYISALKDLEYAHLKTEDKNLIGFNGENAE